MKVLVTGSHGQLGQQLASLQSAACREEEFIFTGSDELDIADATAVREAVRRMRPQVIINCAAYTQVDKAEDEPERADAVNHLGAAHLAAAAAEANALLVHISTDYIFGAAGDNRPLTESAAPNPMCVYGRTKLAGEEAIRAADCRHLILRTSWLCSVYGHNFVKTIVRLMQSREELRVVNDQIGSPTCAEDLAKTILHILRHNGPTDEQLGVYHYANEGTASWYDFAAYIVKYAGYEKSCNVRPCSTAEYPAKALRPSYSVLDTQKIRKTFGITIPHWKDSIGRLLDAYNPEGD